MATMATRPEMIAEAARRLETRGLQEAARNFLANQDPLIAEDLSGSVWTAVQTGQDVLETLRHVEAETGFLTYAVHISHAFIFETLVGSLWTLFGVRPEKETWEHAGILAGDGLEEAYVIAPEKADFEEVSTQVRDGLLLRRA